MRKLISFMHISLDGFVAGPNGELNWVKVDEEIFHHVGERIRACDSALYGRTTFQMMENYWPTAGDKPTASKHEVEHSKWYASAHKIVLSKSLSGSNVSNTTILNENLVQRINEIKQQPGPEILVFGSPTATHVLMEHNLIDGYWLFMNPILLGKGTPLFVGHQHPASLKLESTRLFDCGVTELSYTVERA